MGTPIKYHFKHQYPYENLSLTNIEGEQWKEIEGFNGAFEVSNFGRIKSVPRRIEFVSNGREISFITRERIIKQRLLRKYNPVAQTYTNTLTVSLQTKPFRKTCVVARLVCHAFIMQIDPESDHLIIAHLDGDALNNYESNLVATDRSRHFKHIYAIGRMPTVASLNKYITTEARRRSAKEKFRSVSQYDMSGSLIAEYACLSDAARAVGAHTVNIRAVLTGKKISAAGFLWREGKGRERINIVGVKKRIENHKSKQSKAVTRYDLSGNRLGTYISIADAAKAVNGKRAAIRRAISGKARVSYKSLWCSGTGAKKIKVL